MANIDKHEPGSICWLELATSDQPAAKTFYESLFGWQSADMPMGPNDFYTMFKLKDRDVAAGYTIRPEQRAQGVPPHWMMYVLVESADAAAARVPELGGQVLAPPFDVYDVGRMAVAQDPTGAVFTLWQAKSHSGLGITGEPGSLCWVDLSTPDRERAGTFYEQLFGWKIKKEDEDSAHNYWHLANGETFFGGIPPAEHRDPHAPPHWLVYFAVADCQASTDQASRMGATVYLPPMFMENVGRMAVLADPQGATFALFEPTPRASS